MQVRDPKARVKRLLLGPLRISQESHNGRAFSIIHAGQCPVLSQNYGEGTCGSEKTRDTSEQGLVGLQ